MAGKTWVILLGGLLVGFFAAFLLVPVLSPQYAGKPIGLSNQWGAGMMPRGYMAPNGSYSQTAPGGNYPWMGYGMMGQGMMGNGMMVVPGANNGFGAQNLTVPSQFNSNGQQIYFTGTSRSGRPIGARMMGMQMVDMRMGCAYCHGDKGQGSTITMPMGTWKTPRISYNYLTQTDHGQNMESAERHEAYTDRTLKRAIVDGANPDGETLEFPMPRWSMSDSDLNDIVNYLKKLP
ncbi:c-type cytochrome [Metallumcola ferriviriculae]|uniref:C-type cytochrome n=1 Tax=Metallumcola ferriviriculae TaxID=3039180 RepID=A0AAU0ULI8_9FIRM|nr:c-type cytochrome [Desulfitibacteraceae bacterium MK1]